MISTSAELEGLIDGAVTIPAIPALLTEITAIFNSPHGSAKDAAAVIGRDAAIATRALQLVNSSLYGLKNPIADINLACSMLGLAVINNLVVQASVLQTFASTAAVEGFDVEWFWDHSFKTAVACRMLAQLSPAAHGLGKDDAYTCGLIHDIGKLILIDSHPARFGEALTLSNKAQIPLARAESEVFGFHHAHVAGLLAARWKFGAPVQAAVTFHHTPAASAEGRASGFLVMAANTFAHAAASGTNGGYRGDTCDEDAMQALGLTEAQRAEILATTVQACRES
ncbi:MAG TPA: HDOD domain-containing protein [Planctomycetota bacterium]